MQTARFRKQFRVSSACKNHKLKSSHDWKAKSSGRVPTRETNSVCWRSFHPAWGREEWLVGDKHILSAPRGACFYLSEPMLLLLLLLRKLDLFTMIPKGAALC